MYNMEITTNVGCKNACFYCPQDTFIRAYKKRSDVLQMSFDVFKTCLDKIPLYVGIDFSGMSEPWLNPECKKMLLYAHERGYKILVNTTLVGMKISDIDLIASVPFKGFYVHLPCAEGYEKIEVDENYLNVLKRMLRSNIKAEYHILGKILHPKLKSVIEKKLDYPNLITRAGNVKIGYRPQPRRKVGAIGCLRNLLYNILLPNGDVILCCMDYGMKHVLGNLLSLDYDSLFQGDEFLKVKRGLRDGSLDILCRYCDHFGYDISLSAKICNPLISGYQHLKNIHNLRDLVQFVQVAWEDILIWWWRLRRR